MEVKEILSKCDHTLLAQTATWKEIRAICDDGMKYGCASVCIPASYVKQAAEYVAGRLPICTVIGFPNGYDTTAAKCFMATDAVENGAEEVDMVINLGWVKDQKWDDLLAEIKAVKAACKGKLLKVIIECCFLTDEEKIKMCEIVTASGAEYIKTSTGFGTGGATREDVALFAKHVGPDVKIKAAGGIADLKDAEDFINLGASRLGTSRIVKAVKAVGECVGEVVEAAKRNGYEVVQIADHGNAERMADEDGEPFTAHTTNLVPFYIVGASVRLRDGRLADIAPTMLDLMGLEKPKEMDGETLIVN